MQKEIFVSQKAMDNICKLESEREFNRLTRNMRIDNRPKTIEQHFDETVAMMRRKRKVG